MCVAFKKTPLSLQSQALYSRVASLPLTYPQLPPSQGISPPTFSFLKIISTCYTACKML